MRLSMSRAHVKKTNAVYVCAFPSSSERKVNTCLAHAEQAVGSSGGSFCRSRWPCAKRANFVDLRAGTNSAKKGGIELDGDDDENDGTRGDGRAGKTCSGWELGAACGTDTPREGSKSRGDREPQNCTLPSALASRDCHLDDTFMSMSRWFKATPPCSGSRWTASSPATALDSAATVEEAAGQSLLRLCADETTRLSLLLSFRVLFLHFPLIGAADHLAADPKTDIQLQNRTPPR